MTVGIGNVWPLTVIVPSKDVALQKSPTNDLPVQKTPDFVAPDNTGGHESDRFREKGVFIDLYI